MESRRLEYKLIDLAFGKFTFSAIAALLTAALVVAALWSVVEHERLLAWLTGIAIVKALHLLYLQRYKRHGHRADIEPGKWKAGLVAGAVATGLGWCSAVFLFPSSPFNPLTLLGVFVLPSTPFDPVTVLLIFILAGVTAYASVAMAFVPLAAFAFFACAWLPLAVWLFSFGEQMYVVMGLLVLAYLGVMVMLSRRMHAMVCSLISVSEENQGLRTAQQDNDRRMQRFFESAPGFFYTASMTSDGKSSMPFASTGIVDLFDVAAEEVADSMSPLFALVRTEDIEHVITEREASRRNLSPFHIEFRINHRIKGVRWIELHSLPQREADGATVWNGFMQDITERRRLEESLAAREREFRTLAENFPDVVIRYDQEGRRTYVNRALAELAGSEPDEMLGKFMEDTPLVDPEAYMAELRRVVATREAALLEVAAREPGGEILWYQARFVPEFDADNHVCGVLMVAGDITERRRMEQELQRRETGFRTLAENLPVAVIRYDAEQRRRYINPAAERMLRGNIAALLGKVPGDGGVPATPEMIEHYRGKMKEVSATGESCELEFVLDALPLDRREYFEVRFSPERDEDGNARGVLAIWYDITERKRLEDEMRQQANFRQTLLDAINEVGMQLMVIEEGRINYVSNLKLAREFGYGEEEIAAGIPLMDIVHPDDRARVMDYHLRRVAGEASPNSYELGLVTKSGERREYETSVAVMAGTDSLRVISVGKDITERKRMEDELRLKESVLDQASDGVFLIDENARFVYVNEQACRALGYSREELQGMSVANIDAAYSVEDSRAVGRKTRDEGTFAFETRHRRRDGSLLPVEIQASSLTHQGKHLGLAVARDISERKQAEADLQLLQHAINQSSDAMFVQDESLCFVAVNDAACRSLGYSREELAGMTTSDIDPDYPREQIEHVFATAEIGKPNSFESRHRARDGRVFPVEITGTFFEIDGVRHVVSMVRDISERKAIEQALSDNEAMLQEAQRIAHVGSWDVDMVNDRLTWSDEIFRIWEIDKTKFKADFAAFLETVHPEDRERVSRVYNESVVNHSLYEVEHRLLFPDGRVKHILERGEPQYDEQGKPVRFIGTSLEITERKFAEQYEQFRSHTLELLAGNHTLSDILDEVVRGVEQLNSRMLCSILLLDSQGKHLVDGIAPSLPDFYNSAIDGLEIGMGVGSCGTCAATGERVIVEDIQTHPYWAPFKELAAKAGLGACWSQPVRTSSGKVLGTFAIYHREASSPTALDISLIEKVAHIASLAIERKRMEAELASRERDFRSLAGNMPDNMARFDTEGRYLYVNPTHEHTLGMKAEDLIGQFIPDSHEQVKVGVKQVAATGQAIHAVRQPVMVNGVEELHDVSLVPEFDETGKVVSVLGIGRDMTERYRMQETIAAREQEFRSLAENMPNNIARWDRQGRYIYINPNLERLFGGADHVIGKTKGEAFPDGRFAEMEANILNVVATGKKTTAPRQLVPDENGEIRLHDLTLVPEFDAAGHVVGVLGIGHDMTDIYRMQDELAARERDFRSLAENIPDNIARLDTEGRYLYINPTHERTLGVAASELIGKPLPDTHEHVKAALAQVVASGKAVDLVRQTVPVNGELQIHEVTLVPEFDATGHVVSVLGLGRNMTEFYRMQETIVAREQEFRSLAENMPDSVVRWDSEGRYTYINPTLAHALGTSLDEIAGKLPSEAFPDRRYEPLEIAIAELLAGGEGAVCVPQPVPTDDGQTLFHEVNLVVERNAVGEVTGVLGIGRDVTEHRRMQETIAAREQEFRSLAENSPDSILRYDRECRQIYANPPVVELMEMLLGRNPVGETPNEAYPDGSFNAYEQTLIRVLSSGEPEDLEIILPDRGAGARYHMVRMAAERNLDGKVIGVIAIGRDITAIRESEQRLAHFVDNLPGLAYTFRLSKEGQASFPYVSQAVEEIYGLKPEEAMDDFASIHMLAHPDDRTVIEAAIAESARTLTPFRVESRVCRPGEPVRWLDVRSIPQREADGGILWYGLMLDISERKHLEFSLAAREQEFRSLAESSPDFIIRYDRDGRTRYLNTSLVRELGLGGADEVIGKRPSEIWPDGRFNSLEQAAVRAVETGEKQVIEMVSPGKNGEMSYSMISIVPERDTSGNIIGTIASGRDVTALRAMERLMQMVGDHMPGALTQYRLRPDLSGELLYASRGLKDLYGFTREDLAEGIAPMIALIHPDDLPQAVAEQEHAAKTLTTAISEFRVHHPEKGEIWVQQITTPVPETDGSMLWYSLMFDVTERKQAQQRLELLEHAIEVSSDAIYLNDDELRFSYVNEAACSALGYTREELLAMGPHDIDPGISREIAKNILESSPLGIPVGFETQHRTKDGRIFPVELHGIHFERGGRKFGLSVVRDITERKRMELLVAQERATLRTFFGAMPSLAWMKDSEGRYLACNPMFEQLYGAAEEELIGKTDFDFVDAELADFFRRKDLEAAAAGKPCVNEEWVTFASDGRRALLETVKSPVFDAEGKVVAVIGVAHDITERKQMSDALAERQAFLDSLFEAIPVPVFYKDREGRYLGFNRAYESVFGATREQLIGKSVFDTHPRELAETYHAKDAEVFERRVALQQYEYKITHANGTLRDVLFSKAAFTDAHGEVSGLIGAVIDITERKRAELALRASEEQAQSRSNLLNAIVESSPDVIVFALDTQYRYLSFNRKHKETMRAIWGKEIAAGMSMLDVIGDHPDREKAKQGFDRALSGESYMQEDAYGDESLSRQYWQNYWSPIRAETGEVVGLTCFVMNVTERKRIEEAMRANEEKLSTLFALSPLGIALTDMQGRYVEFNEAFRAICGYPADELLALDYWTLTPREYEAQEAEQLESLAQTGRYGPYEKEYRQKDGTLIPIQLNGVLMTGKDGQQYIWSIVEDITERKKTEAVLQERFERIVELNDYLEENSRIMEEHAVELEASQEQLKEALEFSNGVINAIPDILFEMDRDGRYHGIWTQQPELLAAQKALLLNKTMHEALPPETADIAMSALREAEEMGFSFGKIIRLALPHGESWFELSVSRKPGGLPSEARFIVLSRDVTERHAMEVAREEALAEARRLAQLRSAFMAQMSHELRTPLNGILGYSQNLLQDDTLGEKQAVGLNVIRHSGEHLLSLINGLLDHAAIEAGKFELVPDNIELEPFLGGIIGIIRVRAEQKNLAFSFEAGNDLPGVVRGDAQRLRQVLINLLANAVKFTDSGFVTLRVRLAAPSRILFEIRDSGIGIAADQLESIFLPFEQAGEIQRRAGGSGLGLSISRTLVRLMGGDIRVESRPGAGSTFSFEIEIGVVQSGRAGVDAAALAEQAETRVAQATSMLPAPPRQELDTLHALALRGSMRDVMRHADSLAEAEARYRPFAEQLRQLARSFQTKALLALIEQYRNREQEE